MLSLGIAAVLAAVLLYYSLRGIEWRQVGRIAMGASPWRLALAAAIATVTLFLRAVRWRVLLNAEGAIGVSAAFWATAAGYFGNNFLPVRGGELVRTFMISSRSTLDTTYVLTTALSERMADAIALLAIVGLVLPRLPAEPRWLATAVTPLAIAALLGALVIALLPTLETLGGGVIRYVPRSLRPTLGTLLSQSLRGLRAFHDARRLSAFVALTALIWSLDAVATVIGAAALGFVMPFAAAFLLLASLGLGSALPSTPGYIGIYQFVAVSVLTPFGFSRTDAIAYILVAQALTYVVIGLWGALGLLRYRRVRRSK
jgi:uncharacterized protein (TIRG00374 family)